MKPNKDAYGQEVWAYFKGRDSYEVVERDDGFVGLSGGAPAYFAKYKNWSSVQKKAIKFAKGRVLDIGAGAGRVSLYLQKKGLNVIAIDNSPLAIKVCKGRGVKQSRVLPIEKIGIFKPNSFDTVVMFGNNFGLFGSCKKAKKLLRLLHKITSPDALILAESNQHDKTSDSVHLSYQRFNKRRGRMKGQIRIRIRFRKFIGDWFDYLLVSKGEMKDILNGTGWRVRRFIVGKGPIYTAVIEKEQSFKFAAGEH